jgi:Ca2+-binding RTX toxin-like protein
MRYITLFPAAIALMVGVAVGVALAENITGTNGPDNLIGTPEPDTIRGLGGPDTIKGKAEEDDLSGGAGGDVVRGGASGDFIQGAGGDDELRGGAGDEAKQGDATKMGTTIIAPGIEAGFGDDTVFSGAGSDRIDVSGDQANGNQDEVFCGESTESTDLVTVDSNDITHDMGGICKEVTVKEITS